MATDRLTRLVAGMEIPYGGTRVAIVDEALAAAFEDGDALVVRQDDGELIHIPRTALVTAHDAVSAAVDAFAEMGSVTDDDIDRFYLQFADRLADDETFGPIASANECDVDTARTAGRSVTRLVLDQRMRDDMIDGLRQWASAPGLRGSVVETIDHDRWRLEQVRDGLGVVGFVFEGRPNVFADATGVLRGGNTVVFRIGSDALGTARAIMDSALTPALAAAGLPHGAVSLVASADRAAGVAMMNDPRLGLAVARGSGPATARLGAVARQAGNAVSLHGTGGAWIVAGGSSEPSNVGAVVYHSLDRKVCNTLNTMCIPADRADTLVPAFLHALERAAARRGSNPKLHVLTGSEVFVPDEWFSTVMPISRAEGDVMEPKAVMIPESGLATEWEWEDSPEVTLAVVPTVDTAADLFNQYIPRFMASLVTEDSDEFDRFFRAIDAPFVGNGFTRWVDGQYALNRPELGLSNWEFGRLFGRGAILSGDSAFTVRMRVDQSDPDIGR
ncbi:MAG: aldehyde dehydrogenase family protein [Acidimicrobiia bacterium]|nr:aldehyde dehydrogenase family protein [Acidimicrobiia bacterium]